MEDANSISGRGQDALAPERGPDLRAHCHLQL